MSLPNAVEAVVQQEEQEGWGSRGRGRSGGSGSGGRAHEQGPGGEEEAEAEELQGSSDEVEEGEGRGGLPGGDPSLEMLERNPSEVWHQVRQLTPKVSVRAGRWWTWRVLGVYSRTNRTRQRSQVALTGVLTCSGVLFSQEFVAGCKQGLAFCHGPAEDHELCRQRSVPLRDCLCVPLCPTGCCCGYVRC